MPTPTFRFASVAVAVALSIALSACGDSPEQLIAAARTHLDNKDPTAASIELKNALAKNPDLAEARFLLGRALLDSGDAGNAEIELRKALDLNYSGDQVALLLSRSLLNRAQFKTIIDDYAAVEPGDAAQRAELKTTLGIAYTALGKTEQAKTAFASALAAQPEYAPARLGQARLLIAANDMAGAQAIVDSILNKEPKQVDALMFRAGLLAAAGQREAALATYQSVLTVRPENAAAHSALMSASLQDNKLDQAQQQLDAMRQALPKSAQTQYMQAMLAFQQKKYSEAKSSVQTLLRLAPSDPRLLQLAGAIEFETKSDLQAQEYLTQALARMPDSEFARRLLIRSYLRTGQTHKAVAALTPVLESSQPASGMLTLAGEVYMQVGDAAKAERYFSQARQLDPANAKNRTALAMLQVSRGDERGMGELAHIAANDAGASADMALIVGSLGQKRFDQALQAIDALAKKQPDNLVVHNLRAAALHGKGDVAGARRSLENALQINPAYMPAVGALARLDMLDNKPEQAAGRFEVVLAKDSANVLAMLALAELRQREGKAQAVNDLLKRAVAAAPNDATAHVALINFHLQQKDAKSAMVAAQEALVSLPERPEVLDAAGRAMQEGGDLAQAGNTYNRLITLLPNTPQPYLRLAEVQLAGKNREAARETLARGLRSQPESLPLQRAVLTLDVEDKQYAAALTRARAMQKQAPQQAIGYVLEGDVQAAQKAWKEAQAAYRNGLGKVPNSSDLAVRLHAVLTADGQNAEAAKLSDGWLKAHPKELGLPLYLANAALTRKDYATAATLYRRMLEVQPNNAAFLNDLAWALGQLGDANAIGYAEKANQLAPNQPAMMDTLGMLQVQQGQVEKGTELLRKAVALAPQAGEIRLNFARALIKSGDKRGARAELETLLKLGDTFRQHAEVNELLKTL